MRGASEASICEVIASRNSDTEAPIIFPLGSKIATPSFWRIVVAMILSFFICWETEISIHTSYFTLFYNICQPSISEFLYCYQTDFFLF